MDLFDQKPDKQFHSPILIYSITINRQFKFSWIEKGEKTKWCLPWLQEVTAQLMMSSQAKSDKLVHSSLTNNH